MRAGWRWAVVAVLAVLGGCESTQTTTIDARGASGAGRSAPADAGRREGAHEQSKPLSGRPAPTTASGRPRATADGLPGPEKFDPPKVTRRPEPAPPAGKAPQGTNRPTSKKRESARAPSELAEAEGTKPVQDSGDDRKVSSVAYAAIAKSYNERSARLAKVWARAVVSVEFKDEEGGTRREQGEGHFQVIQPSKMALSAGKLSEVVLWIGCDADLYWFIDAAEHRRAWVGSHERATRRKIESLGMPAAPRELLALTGLTALPRSISPASDPVVRESADRSALEVEVSRGNALWRYTLDARTYEASRIEVLDPADGSLLIDAELGDYAPVKIKGDGSPPRIARRMRALHVPSGSTLGLSISDMSDGGTGRLQAPNFDFDALRELLGVREVVDLDAETPARRPAAVRGDGDSE